MGRKLADSGQDAAARLKEVKNQLELFSRAKRESRIIFSGGLWNHQEFLIRDIERKRSICHEGQVEVIDDFIHNLIVRKEKDDLHVAAALREDELLDLVSLANYLGPAVGGDGPKLPEYRRRRKPKTCLPNLPSVGIGIKALISDRDLPFIFAATR